MKTIKIKSIKKLNGESYHKYDIEVGDNHNFFAAGVLVHNSSITCYYRDGEFGVCSRNLELKESEGNAYWKAVRELNIEGQMREYGKNISLQGELVGPGIQKNIYKLDSVKVYFFTGYDIDNCRRFTINELGYLLYKLGGLDMVPMVSMGYKFNDGDNIIEESLKMADGKSILNGLADREGIVFRSLDSKISFKAISNKYLIKNGE